MSESENFSQTYSRLQKRVLDVLNSMELLRIRSTNEGVVCYVASMKVSLASSLAFQALSSLKAPGRVRGSVITEEDFSHFQEHMQTEASTRAITLAQAMQSRFAFVGELCSMAEQQSAEALKALDSGQI